MKKKMYKTWTKNVVSLTPSLIPFIMPTSTKMCMYRICTRRILTIRKKFVVFSVLLYIVLLLWRYFLIIWSFLSQTGVCKGLTNEFHEDCITGRPKTSNPLSLQWHSLNILFIHWFYDPSLALLCSFTLTFVMFCCVFVVSFARLQQQ